jgi:hypothetical protein
VIETTVLLAQSTVGVDNFVGNCVARRAEARQRGACHKVLKT